jgi:putative metallohydrolase (TIGR04338 family)
MTDLGRQAVYAAEIAAFEGTAYESLVGFDELVAIARLVNASTWWPHEPVQIVRARRDASSSSTRQRGSAAPVVRLAAPQMTPATMLHELAHVLAGLAAGHGPEFRRAHVDLVGFALGDTEASWLLDAYAAVGLAPGRRAWPTPSVRPGAGGPIAL